MADEVQNNELDIEKMNLMVDAMFDDSLEVVARLIEEEGLDVNARDEMIRTPLIWAVIQGRVGIVKFLLHKKGDIHAEDTDGQTIIWNTIRTIQEGGFQDRLESHIEIIHILGSLDKSIFQKKYSFTGSSAISILHYALTAGVNLKVIETLIRAGAPVDSRDTAGNTILVSALESLRKIKVILESVDDKIEKEQMINSRNNRGETPILTLISGLHSGYYVDDIEDKVKLLIKHGADVRIPDNSGTTPIEAAEATLVEIQDNYEDQEEESSDSDEEEDERNERIEKENERIRNELETLRNVIKTLKAASEAYENKTRMKIFEQKKDMARIPVNITGDFLGTDPKNTIGGNKTKKRNKSHHKKSHHKKSHHKKSHRKKSHHKKSNRTKSNRTKNHHTKSHRKKYNGRRSSKK